MKIGITKITSVVSKVSDITSGDKKIPGIMLTLSKTDDVSGKLAVCFSDGHKSFIEEIDVEVEATDKIGSVVVDFSQFARAISNCQPSGIIKVTDITIQYCDNNIIKVSTDQIFEAKDNEGNVTANRKMTHKTMDLLWVEPGSDIKTSILTRMDYNKIFESESCDVYDKATLVDALTRTTVEKGSPVYFSNRSQIVFVNNKAHVTVVPISGKDVTMEELDALRGEMSEQGTLTEDAFNARVSQLKNTINQGIILPYEIAKALIGILNKSSADKVYISKSDAKFCNIFIDTDEERIGVWCEMVIANKAYIGAVDRYTSMEYKNYQVLFMREFLSDIVKSALNATSSEKVALKFESTTVENPASAYDLVIASASSASSVSDVYRINADDVVDTTSDLIGKTFNCSLKVLSDMIAQLKTDVIALDFNVGEGDITCIRLSEVNWNALIGEYSAAVENIKNQCAQAGIEYNAAEHKVPVDVRTGYRLKTLLTRQFTMLSK